MSEQVHGQLRLSKGAWLFRPDDVDVLLRVEPSPAPSTEGFMSAAVNARLLVKALAVHKGKSPVAFEPRTGIPEEICGVVRAHEGDDLVVDAGIPVVILGAGKGGPAVGEPVRVEIDVDGGVRCVLEA